MTYEIDYLYPAGRRLPVPRPNSGSSSCPQARSSYHGRQPIQYVPAAFGGPRDKTGLTYVDLDPATLVTFRLESQPRKRRCGR